mmetsp:Transcript_1776/g.5381  ORF Transcript_1776/g.5381 Transcript_1776/m.5381 type:complete len:95 (-) Transcript_1776:175-459(-)
MFVHVQSLARPGQAVDMAAVPCVEDGVLGQLLCICDPSVASGELWGPPGLGGLPVRIAMEPPKVLVDEAAKEGVWEACERAVGAWDLKHTAASA